MVRVRSLLVLVTVLGLGAAFVAAADTQAPGGARRGFRGGLGRDSLLRLLRMEQVQKELKLSEEQIAKVSKVSEEIRAEMTKQFTALREIEDREKQRAKMTELADQFERKSREGLRKVLAREQWRRLYQIRMQVRAVLDSLANKRVASRLKLTEEQQKKVAQISKDMQAKRSELFASMRDASQEQRIQAFQKYLKLRAGADEKALGLLTAEQKEAFEKMKGEKIELPTRRGRQ